MLGWLHHGFQDVMESIREHWLAAKARALWLWGQAVTIAHYPIQYSRGAAIVQGLFVIVLSYWFRQLPAPGIAIACLGLAAAIMAVRGSRFTRTEEVAWIAIAFLLFVVEIRSIGNDRGLQNSQHLQDLAFFQQQFDGTNNRFHDIEAANRGIASINVYLAELRRKQIPPASPKPVPLKIEALRLAREIFNFVSERKAAEPQFVMPNMPSDRDAANRMWQEATNKYSQLRQPFEAETQREWLVNYTGRVASVVGKLKDKSANFERSCDLAERHPQVDFTYILCAQAIQAEAEKLPD